MSLFETIKEYISKENNIILETTHNELLTKCNALNEQFCERIADVEHKIDEKTDIFKSVQNEIEFLKNENKKLNEMLQLSLNAEICLGFGPSGCPDLFVSLNATEINISRDQHIFLWWDKIKNLPNLTKINLDSQGYPEWHTAKLSNPHILIMPESIETYCESKGIIINKI